MNNWKTEPLGRLIVRKVLAWWNAPVSYPWPEGLNAEVQQSDSACICHRCCTPQEHTGWFCSECGTATGPYNNYLPYIYIFSMGEVVRAGVGSRLKWTRFTVLILILFSAMEYLIFAPIYWFRMHRNWKRQSRADDPAEAE